MKIKKLMKKINQICYEKGWLDDDRTFGDYIALVHSELSEALEEFRDPEMENRAIEDIYWSESLNSYGYVCLKEGFTQKDIEKGISHNIKPEGIPIELADAIIRILDMCNSFNIDIEEAIRIKLRYNQTRPFRHGGKGL